MGRFYKAAVKIILIVLLSVFTLQAQSIWDVPEEVAEQKHYKRYEWFFRQRSAPYDSIPVYYHNEQKRSEITRYQTENIESTLDWTSVGPGGIQSTFPTHWDNCTGRIRALAIHPTDPNTVYIGAASGGLWKTTDGGTTWNSMSSTFQSISFGAIAIDPSNPNVVYAGTGEWRYSFSKTMAYGDGMYKTTDGGATWTHIINGFGQQTHFSDIIVDPANSNYVYASLAGGNWFTWSLSNEGVWRSTDAGTTWNRVSTVNDPFDLGVTGSLGVVYAAFGGARTSGGFYVSTDFGVTWTQKNTGLPTASTIGRMQIAESMSVTYAVVYLTSSSTVAYKTTNAGTSWSQIAVGNQLGGSYDGSSWSDQGSYDLCIAKKPTNNNEVFIGNIEIHKSTDGNSFSPVRITGGTGAWDSPMHVDYHIIKYAPSNNDYIYVGCDGGVYRSTDGGANWESLNNNLTTIQFYRMASHPSDTNQIFGGAQDNGCYRTLDKGASDWQLVSTGDGMSCFYDHTNPNIVYFSTQYGGLKKSTNGGVPWGFTSIKPTFVSSASWLVPFFQHPTNANILYTAAEEVYRSTNGGSSWTQITSALSNPSALNTMAMNPVDPNNMITAASDSYDDTPDVFVSTNAGFNWTDITANIPGTQRYIPRVYCDPNDANTMYVVKSGYGSGKLYKSSDLGATWSDISGDLPDIPTSALFVDPDIPNNLYIGNDFGVYLSTNGGTNWVRQGNGMPYVVVMDFNYLNISGKRILRAATYGASAFQAYLPDVAAVTLTSPNGGEAWEEGTQHVITWNSTGVSNVDIDYSTNNGSTWTSVTTNYPAAGGTYTWTLPDTPSDQCLVKITDASNSSLLSTSGQFAIYRSVSVPYASGWNLLGLPLDELNNDPAVVFPSATSSAYGYTSSYYTMSSLLMGEGFWLQFASGGTEPVQGVSDAPGTVNVSSGWNIISGYDYVCPTADISSVPSGIISTNFYNYNGSYNIAAQIEIGKGYWIKCSQAGTLTLPSSKLTKSEPRFAVDGNWPALVITDAAGNSTTLYISEEAASSGNFSLPPLPPEGLFDVRFGSDALAAGLQGFELIKLQGAQYPVTIRSNGAEITLRDGLNGTFINTALSDGDEVTIGNRGIMTLQIGSAEIPVAYELFQNYPNPFNPETNIKFALPEEAKVEITVYNQLGETVERITNEVFQAGYHSIQWNAARYASGVYFYRITTDNFTDIKKMMLLK